MNIQDICGEIEAGEIDSRRRYLDLLRAANAGTLNEPGKRDLLALAQQLGKSSVQIRQEAALVTSFDIARAKIVPGTIQRSLDADRHAELSPTSANAARQAELKQVADEARQAVKQVNDLRAGHPLLFEGEPIASMDQLSGPAR